jgi:hypothetical protein
MKRAPPVFANGSSERPRAVLCSFIRPLRHLNGARFRFFHLWQCEGKDAVLQLGGDPTLINLARKVEAAGVMPDIIFDIEGLETLIFRGPSGL